MISVELSFLPPKAFFSNRYTFLPRPEFTIQADVPQSEGGLVGLSNMFLPAVPMGECTTLTTKYYPSWEGLSTYLAVQSLSLLMLIESLGLLIDTFSSRTAGFARTSLTQGAGKGALKLMFPW